MFTNRFLRKNRKNQKLHVGLLAAVLLLALLIIRPALAQQTEPPEEPRSTWHAQPQDQPVTQAATTPTGSAGIAWADPNGTHSVYDWFMTMNQMGHLIQSYQNYGSDATGAYFHHGIDVITNNYGANVYAVSGGQVVNIQNYNSGDLYWEVAILDPEGYVWQYHHVDNATIPQAIRDAYTAWQANHATGGYIAPGTLIGKNVNWTVFTFGYYFHHIHLNILADNDVYLNPLEFLNPATYPDTQAPEIQQIGLLKNNTIVAGNSISGSYGLYLRTRDYYMSTVYALPPYKYEFSVDGGPWTTMWEFHSFPGGANDYTFVNDFYVYPPTDGDYSIRDFVVDLGFTTAGQRVFPSAPGPHNIVVRVSDYSGNAAVQTYWWTVAGAYETTTTGSITDNNCTTGGVTRTFNVTDVGLVTDVNLGLNISHASRGQLQVTLKAPGDAAATTLIPVLTSDTYDNYDVLVDDSSTNNINDGGNDTVATPNYELERTAGPRTDLSLDLFNGKSAQGTWTLYVCDGASGTTGTFNKARLDVSVQPESQSAIGNRAWLDENRNGLQDAGESGLANLKIDLCADAACSSVLRSAYTGADGGYLFKTSAGALLGAGTYYVRVTPASGLAPTYDADGGLDHVSAVALTTGQQILAVDFGYAWSGAGGGYAPDANSAALGSRVWVDANQDGLQQGSEVGLAGVTVELVAPGSDGLFGTGDEAVQSAVTDALGGYRFGGLPAGGYIVRVAGLPVGYTQTADPDQFGATCGAACDGQTTQPLLLDPDDAYVNVDFGYAPGSAPVGALSGSLWLDSDRMNDLDAGELRLAGVTVSLISDVDGSGQWEAGEPVIAADVTDANGGYSFNALPAGSGQDYLAWVNDPAHVLAELAPAYDGRDGLNQYLPGGGLASGLAISAVGDLTTGGAAGVDFAFIPFRQDTIAGATNAATTLDGLIGDTIWLDSNASGAFDAGEGLEGVEVRLYATGGTNLLASATTNENGQYFFAGLNPAAAYVVRVQTATLPYTGLTNFVDPDGGTASEASLTLTSAAPVNQTRDFGYRDSSSPNTISGTVWEDLDADGVLDGSEAGRFQGIQVGLLSGAGRLVGLATTNSSGSFTFSNLPDGAFQVKVLADNPGIHGFWKSSAPNPGADGNSQADPYGVSVSSGQTNATADFGFYAKPAGLGNLVWNDQNDNGLQDGGETGIAGVTVSLEVTYPDSSTAAIKTFTDANGFYSFANLLLDEDFNGLGSGQPAFKLSVEILDGVVPAGDNQGVDDTVDSDGIDNGAGAVEVVVGSDPNTTAWVVQGAVNQDYDFGFTGSPTAVLVSELSAAGEANAIRLAWQTYNETDMLGFALYRAAPGAEPELVTSLPPEKMGQMVGWSYVYADDAVEPGVTYTYWVEVMLKDQPTLTLGPVETSLAPDPKDAPVKVYLPAIVR